MSMQSCTVHVTIFSTPTGFKFYGVTRFYSSCPFLCALDQVDSIFCHFVICSYEEAGRYLETYKAYENKPPDLLMERVESDFTSRVRFCSLIPQASREQILVIVVADESRAMLSCNLIYNTLVMYLRLLRV